TTDGADDLFATARHAAESGVIGERAQLGPEGQAWALRAEAEWHRVHGRPDPELWHQVAEAFAFFPYEAARARWRLPLAALAAGTPPVPLCARSGEVVPLVPEGHTYTEIAARLYVAQKSVSAHVSNILAKLGVSTRAQAAATARRHGLIP